MAGRSPARFLAPLALVAFALALFIVVQNTTKDNGASSGARDAQPAAQSAPKAGSEGKKKRKTPRTYTVKSGDTPSGIAEKVDVPLDTILELNPDLDPKR